MTTHGSDRSWARLLVARRRSVVARLRARALARVLGYECGARVGLERGVTIVLDAGGQLSIGARSHISAGSLLHAATGAKLVIGTDTFLGQNCTVMSKQSIEIGSQVQIAELVSIRDHDHRLGASPTSGGLTTSPVVIEDEVWLGAKATVTRGCHLGRGAVVGAGGVVTHNVAAGAVVVGVPTRPIPGPR